MREIDMSPFLEQIRRINAGGYVRPAPQDPGDCCPNGHPYTTATTFITSTGQRRCRTCQAARQRRYRSKKR